MILLVFILSLASAFPIDWLLKVAENDKLEMLGNYIPKIGDLPKNHYSTFGDNPEDNLLKEDIEIKSFYDGKNESSRTMDEIIDFVKEGASAGIQLIKEIKDMFNDTSAVNNTNATTEATTIEPVTELTTTVLEKYELDPLLEDSGNVTNRGARQKDAEDSGNSTTTAEKESQEEGEEEEEEPDMITGLLSAFLGGLSRPDGSIDVEAITGLLGSLSSQREDGTYDFQGLTDILMSFFGGGGDGGGSDFGAFLGGILGAFIKGVARPPGAKGTGIFVGNLLTAILPALSGPAPTEEGVTTAKPQPLDSGGFLGGLLSTVLSSIGSLSGGGSSGDDHNHEGGGSKFSLFKAIFSIITSIFTSSSASGHDHH